MNYTHGPIGPSLLRATIPMLLGTLSMTGYNLVDTYFVGKLGVTPLAAMGFAFPIVLIAIFLCRGLSIGIMATTSHALGQNRHSRAATVVTIGLLLAIVVSLVLTVGGLLSAQPLLQLLNAHGLAASQAHTYLIIWFCGTTIAMLQMIANDLLIASGKTLHSGAFLFIGLLLNLLLDPLLIFTLDLHIAGAAWATILAQAISLSGGLIVLSSRVKLITWRAITLKELLHVWHLIMRFAAPATLGLLMIPTSNMILTWITASFGEDAVAAFSVVGRIEQVAFIFPMTLGMLLIPFVSQNFGARAYDRIRTCHTLSTYVAGGSLLLSAVLMTTFALDLACIMTDDHDVQSIIILGLRIIPWGFAGVEIHRYSSFFHTGCQRPKSSTLLMALRFFGIMIPLSLLAWYCHSLSGLFYARLATDILSGIIGWHLTRRLIRHLH